MTTIAAIVTEDHAWIAGDRRVSWGTHYRATAVPKVMERSGWLLGLAGSGIFVARVKELKDVTPDAIVTISANMSEEQAGGAIMARPGRLIEVGAGGSFTEIGPGVTGEAFAAGWRATACGSGASEAAGAIAALEGARVDPQDALHRAIRIAASLDSATGAPFDLLHLGAT